MYENLTFNALEALMRALLAQLSPLTGTRASGQVEVTATQDVVLPRNAYLVPVVDGKYDESRLYKVAPNPATLVSNGTGGGWEIANGSSATVSIVSNVGGAEQNLPAGSHLVFAPPIDGVERRAELVAAITNGASLYGSAPAPVKRMVFWQELRGERAAADFFRARGGAFPALMLTWVSSSTLQGRTSGGQQGNTRMGRGDRAMRERFQVFVGSNKSDGASGRRNEGWIGMQAATALLSDRQANDDGESLSSMGAGVEITSRNMAVADTDHYIYSFEFECNQVLSKMDIRTFQRWETWHLEELLSDRRSVDGDGVVTEEPDFPLVDLDVDMPHDD